MKVLMVRYRLGGGVTHRFDDDGKASAAYDVIRDAMSKHREFSNDGLSTIQIALERGTATHKVAEVSGVVLDGEYMVDEPAYVQQVETEAARKALGERALRDAYRAAMLPWPPTKAE